MPSFFLSPQSLICDEKIEIMELEELKKEIDSIVRPPEIRRGQHVFNVVDYLILK